MRTRKLRAAAVVAGFAGVGILVAGTASAMIPNRIDAPIATAVQLQQEDPTSQTAPVPATAEPGVPVEVGSGAIKCDADGNCAPRIKIEANAKDPAPVTPDREQVKTAPPTNKKQGLARPNPDAGTTTSESEPATAPNAPAEQDKDANDRRPDKWSFDEWAPENWDGNWDEMWRHRWEDGFHEQWGNSWDQNQWNTGDWRAGWNKRNH